MEQTQTTKQQIVALIYEQASKAYAERLKATTEREQLTLGGEYEGLKQLMKTIEREIPNE